jgi:hypothetical protein
MSKGRSPRKRDREPEASAQALLPPTPAAAQTPSQPVLVQVVHAVRFAAGAIVDLADAVAAAITKRVAGRA